MTLLHECEWADEVLPPHGSTLASTPMRWARAQLGDDSGCLKRFDLGPAESK